MLGTEIAPSFSERACSAFWAVFFLAKSSLGNEGFVKFDDEFFLVLTKGFSSDGEGDAFIGVDKPL